MITIRKKNFTRAKYLKNKGIVVHDCKVIYSTLLGIFPLKIKHTYGKDYHGEIVSMNSDSPNYLELFYI